MDKKIFKNLAFRNHLNILLYTYLYKESRINQPAITCSKLTIETREQGVKSV